MQRRNNRKFRFCLFPGYNWCGPGCNGPGPPVNDVDAACKAHDKCYRENRSRCDCDQEFLCRLERKIDSNSIEGRHARMFYNYMKMQMFFNCNFR